LKGLVVLDDGFRAPRELGSGDVVFFPAGAVMKWHVKEHVRKLSFLRRALPWPIVLAMGALRRVRRLAHRAATLAKGAASIGSVGGAAQATQLWLHVAESAA